MTAVHKIKGDSSMDDIALPEDFHFQKEPATIRGIKKLLVTILEETIHDYQEGIIDGKINRNFEFAARWLQDWKRQDLFSFRGVCSALELEYEHLWREIEMKIVIKKEKIPLTHRSIGRKYDSRAT